MRTSRRLQEILVAHVVPPVRVDRQVARVQLRLVTVHQARQRAAMRPQRSTPHPCFSFSLRNVRIRRKYSPEEEGFLIGGDRGQGGRVVQVVHVDISRRTHATRRRQSLHGCSMCDVPSEWPKRELSQSHDMHESDLGYTEYTESSPCSSPTHLDHDDGLMLAC